ncbi:hypothetical protein TeGR_g6469 [Tetraparma gracilis]|uniref:dynamin GTPase n=1 Tax=Tetraparma gracilis TaxID=2962635 RepID=A0ABQ6MGH5_9STRA|nr:hypothetical protein TeGR_g6469 [Tetraparma gracilis]
MGDVADNDEIKRLIPVVNKLQDAFAVMGSTPIDLPQIAVVGGQSSGKSSVLENIVGKSFLPRGSGIVTRRPLVLQLYNSPEEYGEFLHQPNKKYYDFNEICGEIEADTDRVCGANKNLKNQPINLRIYSPDVLNLTLVDLPGATKVAVGDQPKDIGRQIKNMIMSYASKPNCLILAVSAANVDLANSDAIEIAKEVDPQGKRTLGVVTKLDLMDRGTDARGIFTGEDSDLPKLALGFVGVVNRSQADINERKGIGQARDAENQYFSMHPAYSDIQERLGTQYLVKKCSQMLLKHIQSVLPQMTSDLNKVITQKEKELQEMGEIANPKRSRQDITAAILKFSDRFNRSIDGKLDPDGPSLTRELTGGARIEGIFHDVFAPAIGDIDILEQLGADEVQTLIRNVSGLGGSLFIPNSAFVALVTQNIQRLEDPSLQCVQLVYSEVLNIVNMISHNMPAVDKYPALKSTIVEAANQILREAYEPTNLVASMMVSMERNRVNMAHPDFIGHRDNFGEFTQEVEEDAAQGPPPPPAKTLQRTIVKEGHANKKGGTAIVLWQKRYLIMKKDGTLSYFRHMGDPEPAGVIYIPGCVVERADAMCGKRCSFQIYHPAGNIGKTFFFQLQNEVEANEWVQMLKEEAAKEPEEEGEEGEGGIANLLGAASGGEEGEDGFDAIPDGTRQRGLTMRIHAAIHENLGMREKVECEILFRLLHSYFEIVKKNIADQVPKAITLKMINKVKEELCARLLQEIDSEDKVKQLSSVSDEVKVKYEKTKGTLELLQDSQAILRDLSSSAV